MKIDGVELAEGERVLFIPLPSRWFRFKNWLRRRLHMPEKRPAPNGIYELRSGSWSEKP